MGVIMTACGTKRCMQLIGQRILHYVRKFLCRECNNYFVIRENHCKNILSKTSILITPQYWAFNAESLTLESHTHECSQLVENCGILVYTWTELLNASTFQAVSALITNPPGQSAQQSADFLWHHLLYDLATISRAMNRSPDDCLVLLHHLITSLRQQYGKIKWKRQS